MTAVALFVLGAIIGSFLNVLGLRWNLPRHGGFSRFIGRSLCSSCGIILKWWQLVPILSFFILKARCHACGARISWQYPIIEIWTGLVFASVFYVIKPVGILPVIHYLLMVTVFCVYIVILIYDLRHKIIPDELVYASIFLSLLASLFMVRDSLLDWLAGPILFVFFGLIWLFSRGRAMGFGDAKLGLSIGFLLGASQGFSAIALAFWIGAVSTLGYLFLNNIGFLKNDKKLTMKSEIPFAPFIILGAWISLILDLNLLYVGLF